MKKLQFTIIALLFVAIAYSQKGGGGNPQKSIPGKALYDRLIAKAKLVPENKDITDDYQLLKNEELLRCNTRTIGYGLNDYVGDWCGNCVKESDLQSIGNSQSISFELIRIESYEELRKSLEVDVKVSLGFSAFSADFSSYLYKSFSLNSYKKYLIVKVSVRNSPEILKTVQFNANGTENIGEGYANFIQQCGSRFILGRITGGQLYGIIEMEGRNQEENEKISATLNASIGVWGSVDGKFNENIKKVSEYSNINIKISKDGGKSIIPITLDELQQAARNFPEEVKTNYQVLYSIMNTYKGVPKYPASFAGSYYAKRESITMTQLNKMAIEFEQLGLYKNNLAYVKNRPKQFLITEDKIKTAEKSIAKFEEELDKYKTDLLFDYLLGNRTQPPVYPTKPELEEIKRDPKWVATIKEVYKQQIRKTVQTNNLDHWRCGSLGGEPCTPEGKFQLKRYELIINTTDKNRILKNYQLIAPSAGWSAGYVFPPAYRVSSDNKEISCKFIAGSVAFDATLLAEEYELVEEN